MAGSLLGSEMMLENAKLVSIIREVAEKEIIPIMEGLVEEGIRWFEISLSDGENGMQCIRTSRKHFKGRDVYIGAGTVTKKEEIDVLSDMGVPYILTPGFDEQIVRYALKRKIGVLPGVLTPSEVQAAANCGIHLVKLFPADAFSNHYIKSLKGPFPRMDYVAVGGVTPENATTFYRLGYKGVAAGSNLVPKHAQSTDLKTIRQTARKYVEAAKI